MAKERRSSDLVNNWFPRRRNAPVAGRVVPGANFVPSILDTDILDGIIDVDAEEAREMARRAAREEGILVGISSGASLAAIAQKLPELGEKPRILTFNYDSGERYLSVPDFLPQEG